MLPFYNTYSDTQLPSCYSIVINEEPSPQLVNRLLSKCRLETHSPKQLMLAIKNSDCLITIFHHTKKELVGFVRITSDRGLNANLWDLAAKPGRDQEQLLSCLLAKALQIIRRNMPGCSISVAAPTDSIKSLKKQGFLIDPNGIRTMGYKLR